MSNFENIAKFHRLLVDSFSPGMPIWRIHLCASGEIVAMVGKAARDILVASEPFTGFRYVGGGDPSSPDLDSEWRKQLLMRDWNAMNPRTTTLSKLVARVRALAAAAPENVYQKYNGRSCSYTHGECSNGTLGCILGQAMAAEGIDTHSIGEGAFDEVVSSLPKLFGYDTAEQAMGSAQYEWLKAVQEAQDGGATWAEAVGRTDG